MRRLRLRFTIRRMMIAVAVLALGLGSRPLIDELLSDDGPFNATRNVFKKWDAASARSIRVRLSEGSIQVVTSADGKVTANIAAVSVTSRSQRVANRELESIELSIRQVGDSVEIVARGDSVDGHSWRGFIRDAVHVILAVPDGVRLDLKVGKGSILVPGVHSEADRWQGRFGARTMQSDPPGR